MPTAYVSVNLSMDGVAISDNGSMAANHGKYAAEELSIGYTCTLSTRNSNTQGTVTLSTSSHGIVTGNKIGLAFTGCTIWHATVDSVSGAQVAFSGGYAVGNLPAATSTGVCGKVTVVPYVLSIANVAFQMLWVDCEVLLCAMNGTTEAKAWRLIGSTTTPVAVYYNYLEAMTQTIPSDITQFYISNIGTAAAGKFRALSALS